MYLEKIVRKVYETKYGVDAKPHQVEAFLEKADKLLQMSANVAALPRDVFIDALEASIGDAPKKQKRKKKPGEPENGNKES
jgi:hypothetical protein